MTGCHLHDFLDRGSAQRRIELCSLTQNAGWAWLVGLRTIRSRVA